jgi:hypothetical protein
MENFSLHTLAKIVIVLGVIITLSGVLMLFGNKLPFIGKLPGDILIQKKNFTFYFPVTTLIIVNLLIIFILYLLKN